MFSCGEQVQISIEKHVSYFFGVILHSDAQRIMLQLPESDESLFEPGSKISLCCYTPDKKYEMHTEVISRKERVVLIRAAPVCVIQRRRSVRISIDLQVLYVPGISLEEAPQKIPVLGECGRTLDISLGGMRMLSDHLLLSSVPLIVQFQLSEPGKAILAECMMLRCTLQPKHDQSQSFLYVSALRFEHMARTDQMLLSRFIQEQQASIQENRLDR